MRYDTLVTFWDDRQAQKYDPRTGKHKEPLRVDNIFCNVTDMGAQRQAETFGGIKQGSKTLRSKIVPVAYWDYVTLPGDPKKYRLLSSQEVSKGYTTIVGEDNGYQN